MMDLEKENGRLSTNGRRTNRERYAFALGRLETTSCQRFR